MITRSVIVFLLVTALLAELPSRAPRVVRSHDPGCERGPWEQLGIRVLECEPTHGQVVLALGDPATARHVALLVPGMNVDLRHLEDPVDPHRGPLGWARALRYGAATDNLAVVLWVGYRTPRDGGLDMLFGQTARAGAAALTGFVARLRAERPSAAGPAHLSVIGHSYGAVVATAAAPGLDLRPGDDLALLASPGAGVDRATNLGTAARVWAGRATSDWVRWVPPLRIGDLGHGPDPAAPAFGARPLDTHGVPGHDRYFTPGSPALACLVDVLLGRTEPASPRSSRPGSRRPGHDEGRSASLSSSSARSRSAG